MRNGSIVSNSNIIRVFATVVFLNVIQHVFGQTHGDSNIQLDYIEMDGISEVPSETNAKNLMIRISEAKAESHCDNQRCFILICTGNLPLAWSFKEIIKFPDGSNFRIISSSYNDNGTINYSSELSIRNLKAEYSGWYGCHLVTGTNSKRSNVLWRYVFIQDGASSHLIEKDTFKISKVENNSGSTFTVPCRPDHPNKPIFLFRDGIEIDRNNGQSETDSYKATSGFAVKIKGTIPKHGVVYECRTFISGKFQEFLIVRVLPEEREKLYVEPKTPFVVVKPSEQLNLRCGKAGIPTLIVPQRKLENAKSSNFSISKVTEANSGFYSCITIDPKVSAQSFLDVHILFNWNVVVSPEKVHISLQHEPGSLQTVTCDSNTNSAPPIIEHCPCVSESHCDSIQELINNSMPNIDCRRLNTEMCSMIRPNSQKQCEQRNASCKSAKIKASGFISCFSKVSVSPQGVPNCDEKFLKVIDNIKTGKSNAKKAGDCLSVGGQNGRKGGLWIEGACNIPFDRNGTLVCFAHRRYFVGGIEWSYILPGTSIKKRIFESTRTSSGPIRFFLQEKNDNAERVESSLTLHPIGQMKPVMGKVFCSARHADDPGSDVVGIGINVQELLVPSFISGQDNQVTQRISLNSKKALDCSVKSFPKASISWYRKNENSNAWVDLNPTIKGTGLSNPVSLGNINITDQKLIFEHFRKENEGTYKCQVKLLDPGKKTHEIERIFIVTLFDWVTILIIVVVVLVILAAITGFLAFFYRQRFRVEQSKVQILTDREIYDFVNGNVNAINPELDIAEQAHLLPYNKTFEFPLSKLRFDKQLGAGAYGTVMKAVAEGIFKHEAMTIVAVKTVHPNADILYFKALLTELKIMIHIGQHPNVVSLLGAVTETLPMREVYLIVEYCRYGNLQMYLHKNRKSFVNQLRDGKIKPDILTKDTGYQNVKPKPSSTPGGQQVALNYENSAASFTSAGDRQMPEDTGSVQPLWRNNVQGDYIDPDFSDLNSSHLVCWSYQIAQGMEHLTNKKVIHGDLAARNVLIADKSVIKIADFGLARQVYKDANYIKSQSCPLPVKWMAPESLRALQFSTKSDVWAFGVVLWEMFTLGDNPYPGVSVDNEFLNKLESGFRMTHPKYSNQEMYDVMLECWREDPDDRPSFQNLVQLLSSFLTSGQKEALTPLQKLREVSQCALDSAEEVSK